MTASRRSFLMGAAALSAAVVTPETVRAMAAMQASADWALATADLDQDVAPRALRLVHGRAPVGLEGTLFRNGPGKFRRPGGSATHWFDGDGLMRAFRIGDGQATLDARFADTPKRRNEARLDAVVTPGFGTEGDDRAQVGSPDDASAANTAVLPLGDQVWALWEGGSPLAMDERTLATRGFVTLSPELRGMPFQAHPRVDSTGRIWNIGLSAGRAIIWRLAPDGSLEDTRLVALPRASYMHDFTVTDTHLILVLQPWVFERAGRAYVNQFAWRPSQGTLVMVVEKDDVSRRRLFELPAFSFFHLGDGWTDAAGTIRFDVAAYDDPSFSVDTAKALLLGQSGRGKPADIGLVTLHPDGRAELTRTGTVGEFPRSDPRRSGQRRSLTVHVAGERGDRPLPTGLEVRNWETGAQDRFLFGDDLIMEEAIFVPKPSGGAETDAWLLAPAINLVERATELHVFEIGRVSDGPITTWRADLALPAGFHGAWRG